MSDSIISRRVTHRHVAGELIMTIGEQRVQYNYAETREALVAVFQIEQGLERPLTGVIEVDRVTHAVHCGPSRSECTTELSTDDVFEDEDINHLLLVRRALEALDYV